MNTYSIIVIGAGAAGLVIANGAAKAGKKVLIVEKGHWGGDCTNYGCIPSKSLIASSHAARAFVGAKHFGFDFHSRQLHSTDAFQHVKTTVHHFVEEENKAALEKAGIAAIEGTASFIDPHTILITDKEGRTSQAYAKEIVIASGSHPCIPDVPGLKDVPYLTNETLFDLKEAPKHLAVMGSGPVGSELSQAIQRLGSDVTLFDKVANLQREDVDVRETILKIFRAEGIKTYIGYATKHVLYQDQLFHISLEEPTSKRKVEVIADALLVASGRIPNIAGLKLENAGVKYTENGITVNKYGRTSQSHIWAVGDVVGPPFFTHKAESHARSLLVSMLLPFGIKKKLTSQPIPRVTFTDPEIASVGILEDAALKLYKPHQIAIYKVPLSAVDRAITTDRTQGFVKIITKKWSSKILGATIVAPRAGEMIMEISVAMHAKLPLRKLANLIHPYPIYNLAIRKAADMWLTQTIIPSIKNLFKRS